jgi:hypothetical protein
MALWYFGGEYTQRFFLFGVDCALSRRLKSGIIKRELLLQDDEIDETTLTKYQREVLTENHEISMNYNKKDKSELK